ncbi:hypothetical protein, partial [Pseudomonas sp. PNPG3]|uniref:hypothetical protein n=1 Tax=Pseudomonas sp. PNPG3 TaxID=2919497 RepID=UPI001FFC52B8
MELKTFDAVVEKALLAFYECFPTPIQIDPNIVGLSEEEPNRSDMNKPLHSVVNRPWFPRHSPSSGNSVS